MTSSLLRSSSLAAVLIALLGTACSSPDSGSESGGEQTEAPVADEVPENPMPEPEFGDDDTVALPIGLVSPPGYDWGIYDLDDPDSPEQPHRSQVARTEAFGCENHISIMATVPVVTDNPAETALDYLLTDSAGNHGDPAFFNALATSGLEVESVETDDDGVTVHLSGIPTSSGYCQSWQIVKQIETTARAATGATSAEVLLEGQSLAAQLGLEDGDAPLTIHSLN